MAESTVGENSVEKRAEVAIYRPFFLGGILSVLTIGCLLGAVALMGISSRGSYTTSAWSPYVLAHANSQLYGWVGLFVMGFSLQQHAPREGRRRLFNALAFASLALVAASILLRFLAEPNTQNNRDLWLPVGILSGVMQAVAVLLFIVNTAVTRHRPVNQRSGEPIEMPWQSVLILASLGWWLVVAIAEPVCFALAHQVEPESSILFIAKWFVPLREAQFLGFVVNMIAGVALSRFGSEFGVVAASRPLGLAGFLLWNGGLVARILGWLRYFNAGMMSGTGSLYFLGGISLAVGAICFVAASRIFSRTESRSPALKFVRTAMVWLLISGALIVLEPAHLGRIGQPFSHAFIGAIRHALTVGFISQMIVGMSVQIVPRLRGLEARNICPPVTLWFVFALLNVGNGLRVIGEIVTDYSAAGFPLMGITGFLELTGLVVWAGFIGLAMFSRRNLTTIGQSADVAPTPM